MENKKKKKTKIDIVLPNYNSHEFIVETIKSIINQTYFDWKLTIVDDNSNKKTKNILEKFSTNKKIKIYWLKKNKGAGFCRNYALKKTKSPYIAFIDSDDIWKKNKLKDQLLFMSNNKIKFSFTSYSIINKKNVIIKFVKAKSIIGYHDLIKSCDIGLSTVMIKKELLIKNRFSSIKTKEDFILWLKLSKKNIKMMGIQEGLVFWRKLDNSLSSSVAQRVNDAFYVYNSFLKFSIVKSIYYTLVMSLYSIKKRFL